MPIYLVCSASEALILRSPTRIARIFLDRYSTEKFRIFYNVLRIVATTGGGNGIGILSGPNNIPNGAIIKSRLRSEFLDILIPTEIIPPTNNAATEGGIPTPVFAKAPEIMGVAVVTPRSN